MNITFSCLGFDPMYHSRVCLTLYRFNVFRIYNFFGAKPSNKNIKQITNSSHVYKFKICNFKFSHKQTVKRTGEIIFNNTFYLNQYL